MKKTFFQIVVVISVLIGLQTFADNETKVETSSAQVIDCSTITVMAPFLLDSNNNSSTTVKRGNSPTGPWNVVCNAITGGSPRVCVDSSLSGGQIYYYQITFVDPDGTLGTNPQVIGPFTTPDCISGATTITSVSAIVSSCKQITVNTSFTGDSNDNGYTTVEVSPAGLGAWSTVCSTIKGKSARECLVTSLSPSTSYDIRVTYSDPDGVTGTNPTIISSLLTPPCGADQVPPTLLFLSPSKGKIIGGIEKIKIQVFDASGLSPSNPVEWQIDSGAFANATINPNYNCGTNCNVYEITLDTTSLSNGEHSISVRATDNQGNVSLESISVIVNNRGIKPAGSGRLLRRSEGSQLCLDCHSLQTHSSQYTSTKYGNWAFDCLTCHTPHKTSSIYLIRDSITTPNSGDKNIIFRVDDRSGRTNPQNSYIGAYDLSGSPYDDGICEACHTKTTHYRNDTSGGDHSHNRNFRCEDCHTHTLGFKALSCRNCHMASGLGNQDVNDFTYSNGTRALIDQEDWYQYGHGATSPFAESSNNAPNFDNGNPGSYDGCLYCHAPSVSHGDSSNPFLLANIGSGSTVAEKNGVCTICHGGGGYDPDGANPMPLIDSAKDIDAYHYGLDHSSTGDGGLFCWDCHDPHGDYNYTQSQRLAYMIQENPTQDHSGSTGWGIPVTTAPTPDFRNDRDGTAGFGWGDYVSNTLIGGTYRGICQVCHTITNNFRQTLYNATHNNTERCTSSCHKHDQPPNNAFKPQGSCISCHATRQGSIPRAAVVNGTAGSEGDDFIRPSRHVSNGTTNQIVTDFDCIVCHSEGDVTSTTGNINTVATYHGGDGGSINVDLRDVDSSQGSGVMVSWPGNRLSTFSATSSDRDRMDSFCLNCHDGDGASAVSVNSTNSGLDLMVFPLSSSISRSGSTVTVTTTTAHGLSVGDMVYQPIPETGIPSGWKSVATVPNSTTFTYTESGTATVTSSIQRTFKRYVTTPANGLVRNANVVTVTTTAPHGFSVGDVIIILPGELSSANDATYTFPPGVKTVSAVVSTTSFRYNETGPNATSSVAQRITKAVSRSLTPFNTNDTLQNANETSANLRNWRVSNNKVINVKDQFNSMNLSGSNWASHHNLNQFVKRYSKVSTTYPQAAAWTSYTTKDGVSLSTARDTATLHCSDCHLNEVNAHGTRNTFYMLSDSSGNDAIFTNTGLPTGTEVCMKCHAPAAYGEGGSSSSTAPRVDAHDGDCGRADGAQDYKKTGSTLSRGSVSPTQIPCLKCHGGLQPGMIHGDNGTYYPWKRSTSSKRYRFMGSGASNRWYTPANGTYTGVANWSGNTQYGCYTLNAADTFGGCTRHNNGRSGNAQNGARPLDY